jgi:two-component system NtrC family response regulator
MIAAGSFREDLYYRLAEIVVTIPTLAERHGDAMLLAKHFLNRFAKEMNPAVKGFTPAAVAAIADWPWPGNVRELENRMKRAVIMADGKLIAPEDLDLSTGDDEALPVNITAVREEADRKAIRKALARTENNISSSARLLGISRPTLYDLLRQYGIQP